MYTSTFSWPRHSRCRWMFSFAPRPLNLRGKSVRYPLNKWLGGSQNRSGRRGEERILDPTGTLSVPLAVQPVASPYTDCAIDGASDICGLSMGVTQDQSSYYYFIPVAPSWSIEHPWNTSFHFILTLWQWLGTPWTGDQPVARPLPNTKTEQLQTDIHALIGIRTHHPSMRADEDISCLRRHSGAIVYRNSLRYFGKLCFLSHTCWK
jgi:hypothetical protein